jgi:hypothetical protein
MKTSSDPVKRAATLAKCGIDLLDAEKVFDGPVLPQIDDRNASNAVRHQT